MQKNIFKQPDKTDLANRCPKCLKPLGGHNKAQNHGCLHCGHKFKSVRTSG